MKKLVFLISMLLSSITQGQIQVQVPNDVIDSKIPIPINVSIPNNIGNKFLLSIKNGDSNVMSVQVVGDIPITLIGTRFRAIDETVEIRIITEKNVLQESKYLNSMNRFSSIPDNLENETLTIGSNQFNFRKNNTEFLKSLSPGKFRFHVKSAISKSAFIKSVSVRLTKDEKMSTVTITGSPIWWTPFFGIEGDFTNAELMNIISSN